MRARALGAYMACILVVVSTAIPVLVSGATPPPPAPLVQRGPIYIDSDAGFTPENGVIGGTGSAADPYVIAGWDITASADYGIAIRDTTAHFLIADVQVTSRSFDAIHLMDLENGVVERATASGALGAVRLLRVASVAVQNGTFSNAPAGVWVEDAANVTLIGNDVRGIAGWAFRILRSQGLLLANNTVALSVGSVWASSTSAIRLTANDLGGSVLLSDSGEIALRENEIAGSLELSGARNATVEGNAFSNGGLLLDGEDRDLYTSHTIAGNTVNGRELRFVAGCTDHVVDGEPLGQLVVVDCIRLRVANLTLNRTGAAVELAFVQEAVVEGNVVSDGRWGFRLRHVTGATIRNNTAWYQWGGPVVLVDSNDVLVYENNFVQSEGPSDTGGQGNRWNASYPQGGNYWASYMGPDFCRGPAQDACVGGDGFGDRPHPSVGSFTDRYPRTSPFGMDDRKPVASMALTRERLAAGDYILAYPEGSVDPQGGGLGALWDFGDGHREQGSSVLHYYMQPGTYTVTLKVTDAEFLSAIVSRTVRVTAHPVARFNVSASVVFVGESVSLDASTSYSTETQVVTHEWDFGDGTRGSGARVDHAYDAAGTYWVRLVVIDADDVQGTSTAPIRVFSVPSLRPYEDRGGFRVSLPADWPVYTDVEIEGLVLEVVALGPEEEGVQTSLFVETDADPTVSETASYLGASVGEAMNGIRETDPGAMLLEGPIYRTIAGHAGVVFAVRYALDPIVQKVAFVVSEDHDRYWILVLTTTPTLYRILNGTFDEVVEGFEITRPGNEPAADETPPPSTLSPLQIAGVGVLIVFVVLLALVAFGGRRKPAAGPWGPPEPRVAPPTRSVDEGASAVLVRFCNDCGARTQPPFHFCPQCGRPLGP